ncbi:hypothetical protein NDA11_000956 [Ustilago hordei]|nr:hypothetical protein NDA11_000956 [Ustilago hordei]
MATQGSAPTWKPPKSRGAQHESNHKTKVANPIAELDSDEITHINWHKFHQDLTLPFLDIGLKYYNCGMEHCGATDDKVTVEAAKAIKKYKR